MGGDEGEGVAGAEEGGAADATGLGGLDGLADGDGAGGEEIIEPVDGFIESAARRGGVGEEVGEGIGRSGTTGCARGRGVGVWWSAAAAALWSVSWSWSSSSLRSGSMRGA